MGGRTIIACESFRWELTRALNELGFEGRVVYIPAILHLRPNLLKEELAKALDNECRRDNDVFAVYGKCFVRIRELCEEKGARLTAGEHCFEMFLGEEYCRIVKEEPGTYFLTAHLAENFAELCIAGLGLDRFPKLKKLMFGHYKRAVFIDTRSEGITQSAKNAASYLGLPLEYSHAGIGKIKDTLITTGVCREPG